MSVIIKVKLFAELLYLIDTFDRSFERFVVRFVERNMKNCLKSQTNI